MTNPSQRSPAAHVRDIPVSEIEPNPHNPRRLFDEEPMRVLMESVEKLGVLVPLTVYENPSSRSKRSFVLLDGERRWRVAQELNLRVIPAIVIDQPTETQNILTMFHIHNVREGWQLMPTALKLKTLMETLRETNERKLYELTKLSIAQIRRCKILLTYPDRFQNMMLAPPSDRMKADFFIELDRIRRPALTDHFEPWVEQGDERSIEIVLEKYEHEVIDAVTDFRHLSEVYKASQTPKQRRKLQSEFRRFFREPDVGIWDISVPGATFAKEAKEIQRSAKRLLAQLGDVEVDVVASDKDTVSVLQQLLKVLREKLEKGLLVGVRDEPSEED